MISNFLHWPCTYIYVCCEVMLHTFTIIKDNWPLQKVVSSCADWGWVGCSSRPVEVSGSTSWISDEQPPFTGSRELKAVTTMPGAKYVEAYADERTKMGWKWGIGIFRQIQASWGVQLALEWKSQFSKGKDLNTQHSEADKHKDNDGEKRKSTQLTVADLFESARKSGDCRCKKRAWKSN